MDDGDIVHKACFPQEVKCLLSIWVAVLYEGGSFGQWSQLSESEIKGIGKEI